MRVIYLHVVPPFFQMSDHLSCPPMHHPKVVHIGYVAAPDTHVVGLSCLPKAGLDHTVVVWDEVEYLVHQKIGVE